MPFIVAEPLRHSEQGVVDIKHEQHPAFWLLCFARQRIRDRLDVWKASPVKTLLIGAGQPEVADRMRQRLAYFYLIKRWLGSIKCPEANIHAGAFLHINIRAFADKSKFCNTGKSDNITFMRK